MRGRIAHWAAIVGGPFARFGAQNASRRDRFTRARAIATCISAALGTAGERCPVDGESLGLRKSIVDEAVQAATSQSAEALALRDRPELGPLGGIAATLRF
jgi:hypothetical protein